MRFLPRKHLPHAVPPWVQDGALFFVTIHCATRDRPQLTIASVSAIVLDAARHYYETGRWFVRVLLLMPDHLHALIAFPRAEQMTTCIAAWKRFTARAAGIVWQRDFFDHRIRGGENWQLKADYIRENPVRKGLVKNARDWPHVFAP